MVLKCPEFSFLHYFTCENYSHNDAEKVGEDSLTISLNGGEFSQTDCNIVVSFLSFLF